MLEANPEPMPQGKIDVVSVQDSEGFGGSDSPDEVTRATRKNDTSCLHL